MAVFPERLQHGSGETLVLEPDLAVVALRPTAGATVSAVDDVLASAGLVPVTSADPPTAGTADASGVPEAPQRVVNDSDRLRWVRLQQGSLPSSAASIQATLADRAEWLGAVYRFPGVEGDEGLVCPLPNALLVRPADGADGAEVARRLAELGLVEDEERSRYLVPYRYFTVGDPAGRNSYELRDVLLEQEGDLVQQVRVETMPMLVPVTAGTNDPLLAQQWGIARIQAPAAWDTTMGEPGVVVCILDEGCDLSHPDLRFSDVGINLGTMLPDGRPTGNHGTPCAGIVAAIADNGAGVAGVAGRCSILPAAFQNWTDAECAAGIRFAADRGASVLSMSFGVYAPGEGMGPIGWDFSLIDPAIDHAFGAGVVLCAATGNENVGTFNRYPSRHPSVIACGASDQDDNRKSPTSPDRERWGSNFAAGVSVVAPGVRIPSTDRQGADGYNRTAGTGGDYVMTFNGTSSATPHVAGLAALLRSRDPALSNRAVRDIIERSADKVGTVPYATQAGFPNGTRNNEMGYGRINALEAVRLADTPVVPGGKDIALVRQTPGWATIPIAFAQGDGTWQITNRPAPNFIPAWAPTPGVRIVTGDFNGNGLTDIALVRQTPGWATIPIAFAQGDGTWQITNRPAPNFIPAWAPTPGVRIVTGDFNGNGLTDIALVRQTPGWATIPIAFAQGDGTWQITNRPAPNFIPAWAPTPGVRIVTGDFNGNGLTDIALVRQTPGWATIPIAFAQGDGTWQITNRPAPNFIPAWAPTPGVRIVTGDFNGNGLTDIALVRQTPGWATIPIAFAQGDGTWQITNRPAPDFIPAWAPTPGVRIVTGDFNGNGLTDIALVRQTPGWATIPIAFAQGDGTWQITNRPAPDFIPAWAPTPGVRIVTGDFNGNGLADIALVRQTPGWATIPIAFAQGDGTWQITNRPAPDFIPAWAPTPGVRIVSGDYR